MATLSDLWQPAAILYPDAELAAINGARQLMDGLGVAVIGRELPATTTTAILFNRVGGRDPDALMQVRVFAPTAYTVTTLARELAARLPLLPRLHVGIVAVDQNEGPTDLGDVPGHGPMRQLMYDFTLQGRSVTTTQGDSQNEH